MTATSERERLAASEWQPPTDGAGRRALADGLRDWGENDPNPDWFAGDCLGMVLGDCGRAGVLIHALLSEIAALRSAGPDDGAGRAAAVAMREQCLSIVEGHTYRGAGTEGRNDLIGMFARGNLRAKQAICKKIRALPIDPPAIAAVSDGGEDQGGGRAPSGQAGRQSPSPSVSALTGDHPSREETGR